MRFHDPQWLLLLMGLVPWLLLRIRQQRWQAAWIVGDSAHIGDLPETWRTRAGRWLPYARVLPVALIVVALARPQLVQREVVVEHEAVDIVVALDLSTSMLAVEAANRRDRANRLAIAREVLADFVAGRKGDRIGLVVFAAYPYTAVPLTSDHDWYLGAAARLEAGSIEDGTALGDAMLAAVNRLRQVPANAATVAARSQAVVLITDGRNNTGDVDPRTAAAAAKAVGIRIHAIGIGARGGAAIPVVDPLGRTQYRNVDADLDEATLRDVAAITGGSYFHAQGKTDLAEVFRTIDKLEKRPVRERVSQAHEEWFAPLLLVAGTLLLLEFALRASALRVAA